MDQVILGQGNRLQGNRPDTLVDRFTRGVLDGGVESSVVDELRAAAPLSPDLAPQLLDLVPRVGDKGRYAVATLAVELATDPGYRPVVEAVVRHHPLAAAYRPWFVMAGTRLDGDALRWWLDLVADEPSTTPAVNYALYKRRDVVLSHDRDLVIAHLVRTDAGPARHAADLAAEVLRREGPCAPIESLFSRWIRDGRFDHGVDTADGGTSAQVLATCLERGLDGGPFTTRWALVTQALEHWQGLVDADDPERRRAGLDAVTAVLTSTTVLAGALPRSLARAARSTSGRRGLRRLRPARFTAGSDRRV